MLKTLKMGSKKNKNPKHPKVHDGFHPSKRGQEVVVATFTGKHFTGPIPPPEMLADYEKLLPGAADRILGMAEEQSRHRRGLESSVVTSNNQLAKWGQRMGFFLALVVFSGSLVLLYQGKSTTGLATLITTLGSLVTVFVVGKRKQTQELDRKR
ncbi:MAG: DUF2335 domain-containing protein [Candidatus Eisenbacteria bacterium]|uniref:DUF2335 domain-containing protein n=1 Tax=Eiseniibacteriota bacterium TaxID=2212470 RepID=A0A948W753_UNCEI|nr:DUF2335 domain-containing protein [Candidatus Eisenbacteria bacterium]MBU1949177.1 DUF2335 domain-containing protein [Candidatus Eisenbacteria bacterium]MBU2691855.1 DUF2335 domain-containing protein [Candidatus Eisenbacteria bacterium]